MDNMEYPLTIGAFTANLEYDVLDHTAQSALCFDRVIDKFAIVFYKKVGELYQLNGAMKPMVFKCQVEAENAFEKVKAFSISLQEAIANKEALLYSNASPYDFMGNK